MLVAAEEDATFYVVPVRTAVHESIGKKYSPCCRRFNILLILLIICRRFHKSPSIFLNLLIRVSESTYGSISLIEFFLGKA